MQTCAIEQSLTDLGLHCTVLRDHFVMLKGRGGGGGGVGSYIGRICSKREQIQTAFLFFFFFFFLISPTLLVVLNFVWDTDLNEPVEFLLHPFCRYPIYAMFYFVFPVRIYTNKILIKQTLFIY